MAFGPKDRKQMSSWRLRVTEDKGGLGLGLQLAHTSTHLYIYIYIYTCIQTDRKIDRLIDAWIASLIDWDCC